MGFRAKVKDMLPAPVRDFVQRCRYFGLVEPMRTVRGDSLLSYLNLFFLQELAQRLAAENLRGDIVECGVYRGGSAGVLAYELLRDPTPRHLWLYDAFAGMPPAGANDDTKAQQIEGQFVGSDTQTRRILRRIGLPKERYDICVGWFDQTFPAAPRVPLALLHVDCDFYASVQLTLARFYPDVVPGGYVVLNDYGSFEGCRRATDEFIASLPERPSMTQIDRDAWFFRKETPWPDAVEPGTADERNRRFSPGDR